MDNLIAKYEQLQKIRKEITEELERVFPTGCEVNFFIRHGQHNPSSGTVVGNNYDGYLRVSHHQAKEHSRYRIRDVHFRYVL